MRKIEADILLNGLDFINESVTNAVQSESDVSRLKYAVLNMHAGVSLILKARLQEEYWALVYEDVSVANQSNFRSGDFKSVSPEQTVKRLQNICRITFTKNDQDVLDNLRKKRNTIEHFAISENIEALKSILSEVLTFVVKFVDNNFDTARFNKPQQDIYRQTRINAREFRSFVVQTLESFADRLNNNYVSTCAECRQDALVYDTKFKKVVCLFCNHNDNSKIILCPQCEVEGLHLEGWNLELICLKCGYSEKSDKVAETFREKIMGYDPVRAYQDGDHLETRCPECYAQDLIVYDDRYICLHCHDQTLKQSSQICEGCCEMYVPGEHDFLDLCSDCLQSKIDHYNRHNP